MHHHAFPALAFIAFTALGPCLHQNPGVSAAPIAQDGEIKQLIDLANAARRDARCPVLEWNDDLAKVAKRHSDDMRERNFFAHENPDRQDPFDRLAKAKIEFRAAAENILEGTVSGRRAFEMWMNSPGHRANLLNCEYTKHGVGIAGTYWTHVFLRD